MATGPDLSNNNGRVDWHTLATRGKPAFVYCKATEGASFHDGYFHSHRLAARHYKIPFGAYHFAHECQHPAKTEARWFADFVGKLEPGDLRPALDLETPHGFTGASLKTWAQVFVAETKRLLGHAPLVYSFPWYIGHMGGWPAADLWIADLSHKPPAKPHPPAVLHQYDWHHRVPGVSGECDWNYTPKLEAIRI